MLFKTKSTLSSLSFCAALLIATSGCGKSDSGTATTGQGNEAYQAAVETQQETVVNSAKQLHGIWLGAAALDEALLEQTAAQLDAVEQSILLAQTRAFISTEMAVQFNPDGTVETAIQVTPPGGEPIAGVTNGTWKIIEAQGGLFVVETTEVDGAGVESSNQKVFTVMSDNRISMAAPVGSALANCKPQIVLDRQLDATANIAENPEATTTR